MKLKILVTTGVFRIRKGKRFPWRFSTLFPQFFLNFSTRSEAECGNFEEILWKLSGKSEWKSFPLEYPENGSWLQIYLLSSIFGVFPLVTVGVGGAGTTPTYIATPSLDCHAHKHFITILRDFWALHDLPKI